MILTIIGARPQFIKSAILSKAFNENGIEEIIVHTGQHYDYLMSNIFWKELKIKKSTFNLGVGSGLQGLQTARIIEKLEKFIIGLSLKPKAVLLYGDTNSTLAGALVAAKLGIKIIHIEAGLRSFNKEMPEEINRIVTDRLSDYLFCSSNKGVEQLKSEGIINNVYNVGDVMYDAIIQYSKSLKTTNILKKYYLLADRYTLMTLHRPVNTDKIVNLVNIIKAIENIDMPVIWPVHPRNKNTLSKFKIPANLILTEPKSYSEMIELTKNSYKVLTDSGGLQKEAYWMKKPCITLREETEWVETLKNNWNILAGANTKKILEAFSKNIDKKTWKRLYGDGKACIKIANKLKKILVND